VRRIQVTTRPKLTVSALVIAGLAIAGTAFYANTSVNGRAESLLTEYTKTSPSPDLDKFMMVEDPDRTVMLLDKPSGKLVEGPMVFRARDGGVLAVRQKVLVRLSGNLFQNLRIWIFGPSRPV
jgi:hypothetical protein